MIGALAVVWLVSWTMQAGSRSDSLYGPFGPEGTRLREQLWIVPGADPNLPLRATLFRPPETGSAPAAQNVSFGTDQQVRRPLVIINHGTDDATREAVSMPVFYWLSRWFVERGYVVLLPQRRGHGATGGELIEGRDSCIDPDHLRAGVAAADDIEAALRYMSGQPFVDGSNVIVVGISTGGWASLALAARNLANVRTIVNFAGGRGGHALGRPPPICGRDRLIEAAAALGHTARVPTLWIYANNDSYFGPRLATAMAAAWQESGGTADLRLLPDYGADGHTLVDDRAGWKLWGPEVDRFLAEHAGGRDAGPTTRPLTSGLQHAELQR